MASRFIKILALLLWFSLPVMATNYYVDNSLPASANDGTSWASAWTNFASTHWEYNFNSSPRISDNDTLYISGGASSQVYTDEIGIFGAPSFAKAITITVGVDIGHTGTVIFDGNSEAQLGGNPTLNNAGVFANGAFILDGGASSNFVFRNFYNTNEADRLNCEAILGSPTHAIIRNFVITNCSNGIKLNPATDVEICNGSLSDMRGDACINEVTGSDTWDNFRVHNCMIRSDTTLSAGNGPDGIQPDTGSDIYNCVFWNDPNGHQINGQHPDAIQSGGNLLKIYNNTFHNWTGSGHSSDPPGPAIHDIIYANNLYVYDDTNFIVCTVISSGYVDEIDSVSNIYWLNNTVVDYGSTGTGSSEFGGYEWQKPPTQISFPTVTNFVLQNNLLVHCGSGGLTGAFLGLGSYVNPNFNINTDITFDHNVTVVDSLGGGSGIVTANTIFRQQSVMRTNMPTFVNYVHLSTSSDFHLASGDTVAKGQGANLTTLFTALGIPLTDKDGNARPPLDAWDIGAYQFISIGGHGVTPPTITSGGTFFGPVRVQNISH